MIRCSVCGVEFNSGDSFIKAVLKSFLFLDC